MRMAGIVCYNPDIKRFAENISSIIEQVDEVIIVDNDSNNSEEIKNLCLYYPGLFIIENKKNLGIAAALNQIVLASERRHCEWVLLLDQDSICATNLLNKYFKYTSLDHIGIITSYVIDRNIKGYFENDISEFECSDYKIIEKCITSGSMINVAACKKCGLFDEIMFIDYVDYDMCFSLAEHGYKILRCNFDGILHEVGEESKEKKIFGKSFYITNHNPMRRYFFSRNIIYCIRKHKSISVTRYLFKAINRIFISLLYEDQKIEKCKMAVKGMIDGLFLPIR